MTELEFAQLDKGKGKPVRFAYEFTYPELTEAPDHTGRMIRKDDPPKQRWLAWQKSVQAGSQRPGIVPPHVMDYFQKTKIYDKPPEVKPFIPPKFTWSPSKLMTFETCPMKFAAESYYKTVPYTESEQALWGTAVHLQAELFMRNEPLTNQEAFKVVEPFVKLLDKIEGQRLIEHKISLDANWKPCEWDDGIARMILDFGVISPDGKTLKGYDYKTGKMKESTLQMEVYAYALAICFPEIQTFDMRYIWLKDRKTTGFKLERKELLPVAKDIRERVKRMKEAWDNENFPIRKNGLCRNWCGATECPYCGPQGRR